jgi:primosomal protein N' (replication factor Y)
VKGGGRRRASPAVLPETEALVTRVLTDVAGVDKEFDYLVPASMASAVQVGTQVRIELHGRRVGGWVLAVGVEPPAGLALRPLEKVRGWGPEPELVDLAGWAGWRWAGRRRTFLLTASAPMAVPGLPSPSWRPPAAPAGAEATAGLLAALPRDRPVTLRLAPAADVTPVVAELAQRGPILVIVPSVNRGSTLATRLRRAGGDVAVVPEDWAQARAGTAVVIGARAAAWAPCPGLTTVIVVDGHDEALGEQQQAPTWNAVAVAGERARRAGVPCVVVSPCPTLDLLAAGPVRLTDRGTERQGWAALEVVDRRQDDPRLGLYSDRLVSRIRAEPRVVCVLNRTGRARLLACASCGELVRCERCGSALIQQPEGDTPRPLVCPQCTLVRPQVCAECGSTRLRLLRVGVTRVSEELEALVGRPVGEVTSATVSWPDTSVLVGTEAVLHRLTPADHFGAVAFIDFDQELLAPRIRAAEEALALLAHASRLAGGRAGKVLVQTRIPDHPVLKAALSADPGILSAGELPIRQTLRLPPVTAVAVVSGPAAAPYLDGLAALPDSPVEILGPDRDRWLVKATDAAVLADALAAVPRPAGRLRVAVDPARL